MKIYTVYVLKHNDKPIYVGCTIKPLKYRLSLHKCPSHSNRPVGQYIKEHTDKDLSIHPLIRSTNQSAAKFFEAHYIEYFGTYHNGCNLTPRGDTAQKGGENHPLYNKPLSLEARTKMSDAAKKRKYSAETRAKMSASQSGENNPFFGKTHSADSKSKMAAAKKGKKHTEKSIAKMRHPVWEHYDEIVRLSHEEKMSQRDIANRFGCSRGPIRNILKHAKRL